MNQSPFESSTLHSSSTSTSGVEVRYPDRIIKAITISLVLSALLVFALMWFISISQPPSQQIVSRAIGTLVLVSDIGAAVFLRFYLGNMYIRADEQGVAKRDGLGPEVRVPWDKIARVETIGEGVIVKGFTLFDEQGKQLLHAAQSSGGPADKTKLVQFIEQRVDKRR